MQSLEHIYLKKCRVLLVEDDDKARHNMVESLKMIFDKIDTASNGETAFNLYSQNHPDIVLSDIAMPFGDGLSLAEKIRKKCYS